MVMKSVAWDWDRRAETRRVLAGFELVRFTPVEEIRVDHSGGHYDGLASKAGTEPAH
jgi:hypothetical protein